MRKAVIAAPFFVGLFGVCSVVSAVAAPINYAVTLSPENNSGVSGTANITLNGNLLTVSFSATGLAPNQPHRAHIHGVVGAGAPGTTIPPVSADTNRDGYVETMEGAPYAGPPLFATPLVLSPVTYATAAASGTIGYTQTFDITNTSLYDPDMLGLSLTPADIIGTTGGNTTPLVDRIFELHGLNVLAGIDGTTGPAGTLVYDPAMPVAAGLIRLVGATAVPEPGTFALLGAGLLGALGCVRKKRASA